MPNEVQISDSLLNGSSSSQSLVGSATVGNAEQGSVVAGQALAVAGTVGHVVVSDLLVTQELGQ
jgi:hypothetical protein